MNKSSSTSGFYKLNPRERLQLVKEFAGRSDEERALLLNTGSLPLDLADRLIENVIGCSGYQHAFTKTRMLRKLSDSYTALHKQLALTLMRGECRLSMSFSYFSS